MRRSPITAEALRALAGRILRSCRKRQWLRRVAAVIRECNNRGRNSYDPLGKLAGIFSLK